MLDLTCVNDFCTVYLAVDQFASVHLHVHVLDNNYTYGYVQSDGRGSISCTGQFSTFRNFSDSIFMETCDHGVMCMYKLIFVGINFIDFGSTVKTVIM